MKISLVVPAFNEERLLGGTLSYIKSAAVAFLDRGWLVELIVCDNNSTDRTGEIARAAGANVVFEPINQIARARNSGAAAATGDWLVFVDADSHPSKELFADVADQIVAGRCIAGGSILHMESDHFTGRQTVRLWNWTSRIFKLLAGSFIFCETAAFRRIGGFSGKLFAGEELELSQRLKKFAKANGKKIVILARHPMLTSARKLHLYTANDHLKLVWRVAWNRKLLTQREACHLWYDGRR
ncbi:MAG TPA: glycosyltransferase [Verrucomicrobiae bacterium]|nr:glycosyltransferase [Verrucomicrobiae bacterium]